MSTSGTTTNAATAIVFCELAVGSLLHCTGLILLLTARKSITGNLFLINLSFVELCYILHEGIPNAYAFIKNGYFGFPNRVGQTMVIFFHSARFLTLMAITADRGLAVRLALRYKIVVTRNRLLIVIFCIWLISSCLALIMWFSRANILNILLVTLESILIVVYLVCYMYIIFTLNQRQERFRNQTLARKLNIKVPFLLVLSFLCFFWIPELILAAGFTYSIWFLTMFYMNNIVDALIYILGLPECKRRFKAVCFGPKIEPCGTQQQNVGQVISGPIRNVAVVCGSEHVAGNSLVKIQS